MGIKGHWLEGTFRFQTHDTCRLDGIFLYRLGLLLDVLRLCVSLFEYSGKVQKSSQNPTAPRPKAQQEMKAKLEEMMLGNKGAAKEMMQRHSRVMLGKRKRANYNGHTLLNEPIRANIRFTQLLPRVLPVLDRKRERTNHKRHRLLNEPIRARYRFTQPPVTAGKQFYQV